MQLHHYGFATMNISKTSASYEFLGYNKKSEIITDPIQNVNLLFLQKGNEPLVELVQPLNDNSPVSAIVKRNGPTLYHCCYETCSLNESLQYLRQKGFITVVKPVAAIAFKNRLISFLYHPHLGLIELLEEKK